MDMVLRPFSGASTQALVEAATESLKAMNHEIVDVEPAEGVVHFRAGGKAMTFKASEAGGNTVASVAGGFFGKKAQSLGMDLFQAMDRILARK